MVGSRVARFFFVLNSKTGGNIHIPTSSIARPSKDYPNLDFWFENKPSGNPGGVCGSPQNKEALKQLSVLQK
jgi:hypothetical protein